MKYQSFIASLINYQPQTSAFPYTFSTKVATKLKPINWWKALKSYGVLIDFLELGVLKAAIMPSNPPSTNSTA